jgi:hypothetical protein
MNGKVPQTTVGRVILILLCMAPLTYSQNTSGSAAPPVAPSSPGPTILADAQLKTLLAPIALYPDPLIAQILPASTYPTQVVLAARWLQANASPTEAAIETLNAEPAIKALLHYPTVLAMMNNQLDWTQSLGVAFLNQQSDVMNAIQELRHEAQGRGALKTTPQQQVIVDNNDLDIVPADPNLVYVPQYDSDDVYYGDNDSQAYLTFGIGYPEGLWLGNNVDWQQGWVSSGDGWHHGWDRPGEGSRGGPLRPGDDRRIGRPWARNSAEPLPLRARPSVSEASRGARPGYEDHGAVSPARGAFQGYQNRAVVQRSVSQGQQSRPSVQARPAPQARSSAPAQAFHAEGGGRAVAAQSSRGSASRGGGGGGGGSRGGGRR